MSPNPLDSGSSQHEDIAPVAWAAASMGFIHKEDLRCSCYCFCARARSSRNCWKEARAALKPKPHDVTKPYDSSWMRCTSASWRCSRYRSCSHPCRAEVLSSDAFCLAFSKSMGTQKAPLQYREVLASRFSLGARR